MRRSERRAARLATREPTSGGRQGRRGRNLLDGWILVGGALVVLLALGMVVRAVGRLRPDQTGSATVAHATTAAAAGGKAKVKAKAPEASAVFGHMKKYGVEMHFPAVPSEMVAIGFHQAWNPKATDMVPTAKPHPKDKYEATKQALRSDASLKMFLMMSRGRGSSEYSAADCAVKPGALILSPVTGVVTVVKTYKLEDVGTDYQIQIKADGADAVRVVMIHLKDVTVKVGDRVEGGVTPVATVRHLPIDNQVNRYLPVPADHTHVQINDVGYKLNETS